MGWIEESARDLAHIFECPGEIELIKEDLMQAPPEMPREEVMHHMTGMLKGQWTGTAT